jgi:hypothetical protein
MWTFGAASPPFFRFKTDCSLSNSEVLVVEAAVFIATALVAANRLGKR